MKFYISHFKTVEKPEFTVLGGSRDLFDNLLDYNSKFRIYDDDNLKKLWPASLNSSHATCYRYQIR